MYKNSYRSENLIKRALFELLTEKKDINKITISEIVNRAGVNRGTFYNHYNNINDVLNQIEDETMSSLMDKVHSSSTDGYFHFDIFIKDLVNTFNSNEAIYVKIVPNVPSYIYDDIKQKIVNFCRNSPKQSLLTREDKALITFVANGISGAFLDYFLGKSDFSLEEIGQYAISLVNKLPLNLLKE